MPESFISALTISFSSIAIIAVMFIGLWMLLWVMLVLPLNRVKSDAVKGEATVGSAIPKNLRKAAAIAVSLALAEMEMDPTKLQPAKIPVLVSAWQLGMRTRQMLQKSSYRKRN